MFYLDENFTVLRLPNLLDISSNDGSLYDNRNFRGDLLFPRKFGPIKPVHLFRGDKLAAALNEANIYVETPVVSLAW